ncbi:TetR/AcrR family transcriptional regulator C-terminal domain-containing protein [Amycolatopsis sp. PS_44_ISF1]|uniref:TetR/AcrR family transcriptional regulator C-terminal domain-containing protein n=1 Tax=Amycolatopsis sp. PS_44_ISF1 TaxID=2974917 RepID=UPI0028DEE908|nr:TetR/AcrR family transcriptional regulator C-terminal domain-containing protein [Amycolatopsis sp. PS_44_ISF1]MDT8911586.1 TetR/AcrR family transcriptional regulator C-terminal domain-containing protein [Amycolatopsis sp. PS_44_ISF1]
MKLNGEVIARTALGLLNDVGLDGLTMRLLAKELGVQAAALYWHLKNKQQLLDAMAALMFAELNDGLEAPRAGEDWADWVAGRIRATRRTMLSYRDGARVFAGTYIAESELPRSLELTLGTMVDAGFSVRDAARGFPVLYHYAVGFTIEEQARTGAAYVDHNPYHADELGEAVDAQRFPLTAQAAGQLFEVRTDEGFEDGLQVILAGLRTRYLSA